MLLSNLTYPHLITKPDTPADAPAAIATPNAVETFIARWQSTTDTEKANYQLFLSELCALLALLTPGLASKGKPRKRQFLLASDGYSKPRR